MIPARKNGFIGPLLLIGLGLVFLLNNLGLLGWEIWNAIPRLWPVILIALGLEILVGRGVSWGSFALALAAIAVIGLISFFSGFGFHLDEAQSERRPHIFGWRDAPIAVAEKIDGAVSAEFKIETSLAELRMTAADDPLYLIHGTVSDGPAAEVVREFKRSGDKAFVRLAHSGHSVFPFRDHRWSDRLWDLRLNRSIPLSMRIETGVGKSDLDFSKLKVTEIHVRTGVGRTRLVLPAAGQIQAELNGGIGETIILIPRGLAAKIRVSQGIGQVNVAGDYQREGEYYISPGFAAAINTVQLSVEGGIGRVVIEAAD